MRAAPRGAASAEVGRTRHHAEHRGGGLLALHGFLVQERIADGDARGDSQRFHYLLVLGGEAGVRALAVVDGLDDPDHAAGGVPHGDAEHGLGGRGPAE